MEANKVTKKHFTNHLVANGAAFIDSVWGRDLESIVYRANRCLVGSSLDSAPFDTFTNKGQHLVRHMADGSTSNLRLGGDDTVFEDDNFFYVRKETVEEHSCTVVYRKKVA